MVLISISQLKSPRNLKSRLKEAGELILTNNGKPVALILDLPEGEDPEAALSAVRAARGDLALRRLREAAHRAGRDKMSMRQIEQLISTTRRERKSRG